MLLCGRQSMASRTHMNIDKQSDYTLNLIKDGVIIADSELNIHFMNAAAEHLCACPGYEIQGQSIHQVLVLIDDETRQRIELPVQACLDQARTIKVSKQTLLLDRNRQEHAIEISCAPYPYDDSEHGILVLLRDQSETQRLSQQINHYVAHDALTGLSNRQSFESELERAQENMQTFEVEHCVCYLDVYQFKLINNQAGHVIGNQILKQFADLLRGCVRSIDRVARISGDEFGVLLLNQSPLQAKLVIQGLLDEISDYSFCAPSSDFEFAVSTGIVAITQHSPEPAQLLTYAELACSSAKKHGVNQIHIFSHDDYELTRQHSEIMRAGGIKEALQENRFSLYCQPIVALPLSDDSVQHYELLLRLNDRSGNVLLPASFIPAAERFGLMTHLDRWVITTAFSSYHAIFGSDSGVHIAINLSGHSLNDENLFSYVKAQFQTHNLEPSLVCFEITETAAINNLCGASELIKQLKTLGCRFALDDFGSGLSSFAYLKNLPVDYLKIDGSFIIDMSNGSVDNAMVEVINQLGHLLGIRTIAECAESDEVVAQLSKLGVDYVQGHAMGSPVPLAGLTPVH